MDGNEKMRVSSDGTISYRPGGTFTVFCDFDLTYFPFDIQNCSITLESWRYKNDSQVFHLGSDKISLRYWIENEQWRLTKQYSSTSNVSYVVANNFFSRVTFSIILERKIGYYLINIIFPSFLISLAHLVTFALPLDAEDTSKIDISFTCLLAYGVFQLMIAEYIPRTSDRIPLLSHYILLSMAYICFSMLAEGLVFICLAKATDKRHHRPKVSQKLLNFAIVFSKLVGISRSIDFYRQRRMSTASVAPVSYLSTLI